MLKLPPKDHKVRDDLPAPALQWVETATPMKAARELPTMPQARVMARDAFRNDGNLKAFHTLLLTMAGEVKFYTFGPNGGSRVRWNFGRIA